MAGKFQCIFYSILLYEIDSKIIYTFWKGSDYFKSFSIIICTHTHPQNHQISSKSPPCPPPPSSWCAWSVWFVSWSLKRKGQDSWEITLATTLYYVAWLALRKWNYTMDFCLNQTSPSKETLISQKIRKISCLEKKKRKEKTWSRMGAENFPNLGRLSARVVYS